MTDFTPTTDEVRGLYTVIMFRENRPYLRQSLDEHRADFDRWLEQHDREVAAKALHLAADRLPAFHDRNAPEWAITSTFKWLHERADRIEAGDFDD